ncbi:hypothetical protein GG804_27135 [Sphingomonas histidinilytica]|uniref:hypothetical protein n=1 Tax=Rhizorhabdus histidinilytica TaxID=439228 RepID=UPI001AD958B7|nr:hypothetical protein [Rhizorhabdus histidinilytica]MBO9380442.1 hypothetical protein [Rhizorhabdus histidinilytica]
MPDKPSDGIHISNVKGKGVGTAFSVPADYPGNLIISGVDLEDADVILLVRDLESAIQTLPEKDKGIYEKALQAAQDFASATGSGLLVAALSKSLGLN